MNKFEQLIEYVINDDEQKARALFHDIVVEKSREIYENLMSEEELGEAKHEEIEEELEEAAHEEMEESLEEAAHEEMEEGMSMDASDQMIDEIEMEETSDISMEGEGEDEEGGAEAATKDDIMNLADKLDELMADFEAMMGDEAGDGDDFEMDAGGDAIEVDDTEEMLPVDDMDKEEGMMEAVSLKAAPKPVTSEEGSINKKSTVAANAGAKGPIGSNVKPVHTTGAEAKGRPAPTTKDLIGKVGNSPAQGTQKPAPATKPHTAQATGVNTKSVVPSSHN